jgi:hypothetical protein
MEKHMVVRMDGDDDMPDPRVAQESFQRMRDDGAIADAAILFRAVGLSGTLSTARRNDNNSGFRSSNGVWSGSRHQVFACIRRNWSKRLLVATGAEGQLFQERNTEPIYLALHNNPLLVTE